MLASNKNNEKEIIHAMRMLKNSKAAVINDKTGERLKYGCDLLAKRLCDFFNVCSMDASVPNY